MKRILGLSLLLIVLTSFKGGKVRLELNLQKGETYFQKMISRVKITQEVNGQEVNVSMIVGGRVSFKVNDFQNSVYDMEVRYDSLAMKLITSKNVLEFNSAKPDSNDVFSKVLSGLVQNPFYIKMTKTGKIKEIKNLDTSYVKAFKQFPKLTEKQKEQLSSQIKQSFGEKAFKKMFEMNLFPESPVSLGESWVIKKKVELGTSANSITSYKLKEVNDSFCLITGDSEIEVFNKDYMESNGMQVKNEWNGVGECFYKVDRRSGWIISATVNQSMKGVTKVKDSPQIPGGMDIPMTMTSETILTK